MLSDVTEVVGLFVQMASKVICFMLQPDIYVILSLRIMSYQVNVPTTHPFTVVVEFCIKTGSIKACGNLTPIAMGHCILGMITNISVSR